MIYLVHEDVRWKGRFYDAKKTVENTDDDLMCWAAAASNVLAWTGWGFPPTEILEKVDQIFKDYQDHWIDSIGDPEKAWKWWFDGIDWVDDINNPTQGVDKPGGGGFWKSYAFNDYYNNEGNRTEALSAIENFFHKGCGVVLELMIPEQSWTHYITCWGYEKDDNNYSRIYISDSDDNEKKYPELRDYEVTQEMWKDYPNYNWWHLQYYNKNIKCFISQVYALGLCPEYTRPTEQSDDRPPDAPTGLQIIPNG
jgi:hypothetical protein